MRKSKLFSLLLLLLCLLIFSSVSVLAADDAVTGSLKVSILETSTDKGIKNAKVSIYLVASVEGERYVLTPDFAESGYDLGSLGNLTAAENKQKAAGLVAFTAQHSVPETAGMLTDSYGVVKFDGLKQGLYLVCESKSPEGHAPISPFLITIPQRLNGELIYDVDAAPKTDTSDPEPTPPPDNPPDDPTDPKLPQTGQLWWPVFAMAGLGIGLCAFGIVLKRRKNHE